MTSDRDITARAKADIGRGFDRATLVLRAFGENARASWSFLARRRRDRRFPIEPYDALQIVNAAVLTATALALLFILADPNLPYWQGHLPSQVVGFFKFLTEFGKSDWILIATGVSILIALFVDPAALEPRRRAAQAVRIFAAAYVFVAVALSGLIADLGKYIIGRARPTLFAENGSFAFDFWSWNADWASMPSGHATTGMALGVALALLFPRLFWAFLCLGFWIAASRPLIGVHYPSDMLAGCLLGGGTAWLVARAFARLRLIFSFDDAGRLVRRKGASGRLT